MKKGFFACLVCLFIIFTGQIIYGSEIADSFAFPAYDYEEKKGVNSYGACDYVYSCPVLHTGDDVGVGAGVKVYASANGILRYAKFMNGYGGMYIIEHVLPGGDRVCTLYAHMNVETFPGKFLNQSNVSVLKGDYLGDIAPKGTDSNGGNWEPHLHFAVRKGAYVNGLYYYYYSNASNKWRWNWAYLGYTKNANLTETTKSNHDISHEEMLSSWHDPTQFVRDHMASSGYAPIKFSDSNTVYLYSNNQLWPIANETIYALLGFRIGCGMEPNWSQVVELPSSRRVEFIIRNELVGVPGLPPDQRISYRLLPGKCFVGPVDSTRLYALTIRDGETRFNHISDWASYVDIGYSAQSADIVDVSYDLFQYFGQGDSIGSDNIVFWVSGGSDFAGDHEELEFPDLIPEASSENFNFVKMYTSEYVEPFSDSARLNDDPGGQNVYCRGGNRPSVFVRLNEVNIAGSLSATWRWYRPNGELYLEKNNEFWLDFGSEWWFYENLDLSDSTDYGIWSVQLILGGDDFGRIGFEYSPCTDDLISQPPPPPQGVRISN